MRIFINARKRVAGGDEGIGMILVLGVVMVVSVLAVAAISMATGALRSSSAHDNFEVAMGVAESGIDATLAQLQLNTGYSACGCTAPASFASADAERSWARSTIMSLAATGSSLIKQDGQGQYLAIRPSNRQTVYSMAWVPSYAAYLAQSANAKARLLKAEFTFAPYAPTNAILTQGDLNFSGSVEVSPTSAATTAPVHTNGSVASTASSLTVNGDVTSSGSYNLGSNAHVGSGSSGASPLQDVPVVNPRDIYNTKSGNYAGVMSTDSSGNPFYTGTWYDLCNDGYVHARIVATPTPDPCSSTNTILNQSSGGTAFYPFRGWNYHAAAGGAAPYWSMDESSSPYAGVYYAYGTDVVINGTNSSGPTWNATVLAESVLADASQPCNKTGGTITWKLTNISNFIPSTVLVAGHDLVDSANNDAQDGLFGAADQVYMNTSSASLTGYVIAGDQCAPPAGNPPSGGPSAIQGVTIEFDQTAESPLTGVIRTTLWLEYPAN